VGLASQHGIHLAALQAITPIIRQLMQAGAQVDAVTDNGETPLHLAASIPGAGTNNIPTVRLLVEAFGADGRLRDRNGHSAAQVAEQHGHVAAGRYLRGQFGV